LSRADPAGLQDLGELPVTWKGWCALRSHKNNKTGRVFPRGLRPTSRSKLAGATPFRKKIGAPSSFFIFPRKLSMWLNDTYGCCVTSEEAFNKACAGIFIEDATVLAWANKNDVLYGADLEPVVELMNGGGFAQDGNRYDDGAPQAIDYANQSTMQAAVYQAGSQGGCVKLGIAADELPAGAGNAQGWFLTADSPDSNEDHCVGACGFGTAAEFVAALNAAFGLALVVPSNVDPNLQGYAIFTWSTIGFVAVQAFVNMTGEAWIRSPSSVTVGSNPPDPDSVWTSQPTPPLSPPPPPPGPTPGPSPAGTITLSQDMAAGVYSVNDLYAKLEGLRVGVGLTPIQWLTLLQAILALLAQFLNPPVPADPRD